MMRILDLFCGAGGAAVGMKRAGATDIMGIDIVPQPEYPFCFVQQDIAELTVDEIANYDPDFIWTSPPCQAFSWAAARWKADGRDYPELVSYTRSLLIAAGRPFVIENVPTAPIRRDLVLTGMMFGLGVIRRRAFELHGFWCLSPDGSKRGSVRGGQYVTVVGHGCDGKADLKSWQQAMDIDWISDRKALTEAVPPAYSQYILAQFQNSKKVNKT